ncbi:MAG: DUF3592 domain-containing protein [Phycisphaerales bacterium]|nr:DUF3592 domain-containing protein [Phycisphaerales bacterium]
MKRRTSRFPLLIFALFWCAILGVFDGVLALQTLRQLDASRRFVPVPARVLTSEVESRSDSDGATYRPEISFEYTVAGRTHQSDTVHYGVWGTSDRDAADAIVDRFPAGSQTTAYFDPDDHARAVLLPGAEHLPSFLVLFLTPFHCVAAGLWVVVLRPDRRRYDEPALDQAIRADDGTVARLRSATAPAWLAFLITLGAGSFLSVFAIALTAGFDAPTPLSLGTLAGLLGLAAVVTVLAVRRRPPPMVLDRATQTIGRPGLLRTDRFAVPESPTRFREIRAITVQSKSWGEVNDVPHYRHKVLAERSGNPEPLEVVAVSGPAGFAEPLAAWIREQVGLARATPAGPPGAPPSP